MYSEKINKYTFHNAKFVTEITNFWEKKICLTGLSKKCLILEQMFLANSASLRDVHLKIKINE